MDGDDLDPGTALGRQVEGVAGKGGADRAAPDRLSRRDQAACCLALGVARCLAGLSGVAAAQGQRDGALRDRRDAVLGQGCGKVGPAAIDHRRVPLVGEGRLLLEHREWD